MSHLFHSGWWILLSFYVRSSISRITLKRVVITTIYTVSGYRISLLGRESRLILKILWHFLLTIFSYYFEKVWIEVRMNIFSENLHRLFLHILIFQESWHPGLTMWHGYLESHILGRCYNQRFVDWLSNKPLNGLGWAWVLGCLISCRLVPSIMSPIHRRYFIFWDSWAKFAFSQLWQKWFSVSRVRRKGWFCCWCWLVLVFCVLTLSRFQSVLVHDDISSIWWHLFLFMTSNWMFTTSYLTWIWLSLNLLCWLWESRSSPDCCRLVHLLLL